MRHKDANLHLAKKRGTGFQKAVSRMSLYICFVSRNIDILKARQVFKARHCLLLAPTMLHKDANQRLTKREAHPLHTR